MQSLCVNGGRKVSGAKSIFGNYLKNPVAYCALHKGCLSVKEMKNKECLSKECFHLRKNEKHEYWNQRRILKERKKLRKRGVLV